RCPQGAANSERIDGCWLDRGDKGAERKPARDGNIETSREKLGGTIAGAFIGALAGLPVGAGATILGAATGALIGAAADILNRADEAGHDTKVGRQLKPGRD